jgi:hypothetical protein
MTTSYDRILFTIATLGLEWRRGKKTRVHKKAVYGHHRLGLESTGVIWRSIGCFGLNLWCDLGLIELGIFVMSACEWTGLDLLEWMD